MEPPQPLETGKGEAWILPQGLRSIPAEPLETLASRTGRSSSVLFEPLSLWCYASNNRK